MKVSECCHYRDSGRLFIVRHIVWTEKKYIQVNLLKKKKPKPNPNTLDILKAFVTDNFFLTSKRGSLHACLLSFPRLPSKTHHANPYEMDIRADSLYSSKDRSGSDGGVRNAPWASFQEESWKGGQAISMNLIPNQRGSPSLHNNQSN